MKVPRFAYGLVSVSAALLLVSACGSSSTNAAPSSSSASSPITAGSTGAAPTGTPILLAMANLQDNPAASLPETSAAAQAAVDYINSQGGLLGHPLKLKVCALLATPESSTNCANQFVAESPVAVIGGAVDAPALIVPTLAKSHIPWISPVPADPIELTSPDAFGVSGGPAANMAAYSLYAKQQNYKSFTFLSSAAPAAVALADTIGKPAFAAEGIGFKVVTHPFTAVDLTPYITQADEGNPNAIALNTLVGDCISGVKAAQQLGVSATLLLGNSCETQPFFKGAGSAWTSNGIVTGPFGRAPGDPDTKIFDAAMAQYAPSSATNGYAPAGFAGVMDFYAAVKAAHPASVTATTVAAAMQAANGVPAFLTLGGTLKCGGKLVPKYPSLCAATAYYYKTDGGTVTPVATFDAASVLNQ